MADRPNAPLPQPDNDRRPVRGAGTFRGAEGVLTALAAVYVATESLPATALAAAVALVIAGVAARRR
jgi:hypothetical protein